MNKLVHLWIMVFMVIFVVLIVKSNDDTQPDSVLKTEIRSNAWPQVLLDNSDDDGGKTKKHVFSERQDEPGEVFYTVCLMTARHSEVDAGTTDYVKIRAYGENGFEWRYRDIGRPDPRKRLCYIVSNIELSQVRAVKIGLTGYDKWFPLYISIYSRLSQACFFCDAYEQCPNPIANNNKCMVWRANARVVENCEVRNDTYCVEN